jgi:hypothetical protein
MFHVGQARLAYRNVCRRVNVYYVRFLDDYLAHFLSHSQAAKDRCGKHDGSRSPSYAAAGPKRMASFSHSENNEFCVIACR